VIETAAVKESNTIPFHTFQLMKVTMLLSFCDKDIVGFINVVGNCVRMWHFNAMASDVVITNSLLTVPSAGTGGKWQCFQLFECSTDCRILYLFHVASSFQDDCSHFKPIEN